MIRDNEDRMVELLESIASNTGQLEDLDAGQEITIEGQSVKSRVGTIDPNKLIVVDSADLPESQADGSIEIKPGESAEFLRFRGQPVALLAIGCNDLADVEYQIQVDGSQPVGGTTQTPLGTVPDPFSFADELGGAPAAQNTVKYMARVDQSANAPKDLTGRMFLEVL